MNFVWLIHWLMDQLICSNCHRSHSKQSKEFQESLYIICQICKTLILDWLFHINIGYTAVDYFVNVAYCSAIPKILSFYGLTIHYRYEKTLNPLNVVWFEADGIYAYLFTLENLARPERCWVVVVLYLLVIKQIYFMTINTFYEGISMI